MIGCEIKRLMDQGHDPLAEWLGGVGIGLPVEVLEVKAVGRHDELITASILFAQDRSQYFMPVDDVAQSAVKGLFVEGTF